MAEHTEETQLTGVLRWVEHGRHSGILELPAVGRSAAELVFVEGQLHLPRDYPPAQGLAEVLAAEDPSGVDPARLHGALRELAADLSDREVGTFRFRRRPSRDGDVGPIDPVLLITELREPEKERLEAQTLAFPRVPGPEPAPEGLFHLLDVPEIPPTEEKPAADPGIPEKGPAAGGFSHPSPHPAALAIWRDQFRLTGDPFALTPDPAFLYLSESHAEALAGLKLGIWERRGLLVMIGEVGTGKTTLVYSLLSQLDSQIETAYLSNTLLSFEEILVSALRDFGVPCESLRRLDLIEALNAFLRRAATEGRIVVLVIDEAQNLSHEAFEGLRLLLNFETYKTKLLQIVLVGQPELSSRLGQPGLRQVRDRVAVRCRLDPLDRGESKGYIEHRLATVGGSADIFTRPALGLLVRKSRGIPRRINILCHNSMLFAYGKDLVRVQRSIVAQAIRDVDGPFFS